MSIGKFLLHRSKRMSRKNLYQFVESTLLGVPQAANVLNVGAGGEIAAVVRRACEARGAQVTSIDISPQRGPDIVGDICEAQFICEFDAVVVAEVLEHVTRPHLAVEKIYQALRPGGLLVLTVPFIFPLHDRPYDYFRFTKYGLAYLFSSFIDVKIEERNGWAEALCVLMSRFLLESKGRKMFGGSVVLLSIVLYPLARIVSRVWPTDFLASGYTVVAIKPSFC